MGVSGPPPSFPPHYPTLVPHPRHPLLDTILALLASVGCEGIDILGKTGVGRRGWASALTLVLAFVTLSVFASFAFAFLAFEIGRGGSDFLRRNKLLLNIARQMAIIAVFVVVNQKLPQLFP